ncbi:MAG: hypothetical protein R2747_09285 [Pyrinomonadaceae bacterium]
MNNTIRFAVSIILVFAFFFGSLPKAEACGPFIISPIFSLKTHADFPLKEFTGGKTGIVPPSFGAMSLFVFYRQLNDLSLTTGEQKQLVDAMENRIYYRRGTYDKSGPEDFSPVIEPNYLGEWMAERARVSGEKRDIETEKQVEGEYYYFNNCLPDAFRTATETLKDRIAKHGNDENTREWLKGQDAVFSNCGETGTRPEETASGAPEWLRQDRQYQIAAAEFYRGDLPAARQTFEAIAADSDSPWKNTARFVAARTLIRQASFTGGDGETPDPQAEAEKLEFLRGAEKRLKDILADASMKEFQRSAQRLLGLVKFRMIPAERQTELAELLAAPGEDPNLYNDLTDYVWLLSNTADRAQDVGSEIDRKEAESANREYDYNYQLKLRDLPSEIRAQDLTDWIFTYQAEDGFAHAFDKWKETGRLSWLTAAIAKADPADGKTAELLTASSSIQPASPAFATLRYHQVRILLANGKRDEARRIFDSSIAGQMEKFPLSTRNRFLAQRTALATDLEEFLKYAPRRAAIFDWDETGREEGTNLSDDQALKPWENRPMFDSDATAFLNEKVPLSVLREAALSGQLPEHLKKFLVVAVWTRAFMLGNKAIEREFTPLMTRYAPEYNPFFSKYAHAANPNEREATGLIAILRNPVIQPYVPVGFGREDSEPTVIDSIRGNWWCAEDESTKDYSSYDSYYFEYPAVYPDFLTAEQKAAGEREHRQMVSMGDSATALTHRAVDFAVKNPRHPQTPEILHLAVRSTRYGCKDENTGKFSKQAFDILHRRYPNSSWTKETPYWFAQ